MSDFQHYDATSGQMPLGWADIEHLPAAALHAAHRGNARRADDIELEHIRRTQFGVVLLADQGQGAATTDLHHAFAEFGTEHDDRITLGTPQRLVRGLGKAGRLAVEWRTEHGIVFTDIDGKEIPNDENFYLPIR